MSIKIVCETCGNEFTAIESRRNKARFCSYKCYWENLRGSKASEDTRKKMSQSQKGRIRTAKELANLNKGAMYRFTKGHKLGVGRVVSEETKEKLRNLPHLRGKENPNWKGGKSTENHLRRTRKAYVRWRKGVFERDGYTCQLCGEYAGYIEAHHIKPVRKYPELIYEINNGMTLCLKCHGKVDKYRCHKNQK